MKIIPIFVLLIFLALTLYRLTPTPEESSNYPQKQTASPNTKAESQFKPKVQLSNCYNKWG
jgi:biopolymer transport protein ExbD